MSDELIELCPFCGTKPMYCGWLHPAAKVMCRRCGIGPMGVSAWNNRPVSSAENERLRKVEEAAKAWQRAQRKCEVSAAHNDQDQYSDDDNERHAALNNLDAALASLDKEPT